MCKEKSQLVIVMEYCVGGSLQALIDKKEFFDEQTQIKQWMRQIASALHYLHNEEPKIIHRDMKPAVSRTN